MRGWSSNPAGAQQCGPPDVDREVVLGLSLVAVEGLPANPLGIAELAPMEERLRQQGRRPPVVGESVDVGPECGLGLSQAAVLGERLGTTRRERTVPGPLLEHPAEQFIRPGDHIVDVAPPGLPGVVREFALGLGGQVQGFREVGRRLIPPAQLGASPAAGFPDLRIPGRELGGLRECTGGLVPPAPLAESSAVLDPEPGLVRVFQHEPGEVVFRLIEGGSHLEQFWHDGRLVGDRSSFLPDDQPARLAYRHPIP